MKDVFSKYRDEPIMDHAISKPLVKSESVSTDVKAERAFIKAFDEYAPKLYRFCVLRVGSREVSEDLVSQTFLQTWRYIQNGKKIDLHSVFLYRVLRNLIVDHYRSKHARTVLINESMASSIIDETCLPEKVEDEIEVRRIINTFSRLSEEQRETLHWRFVDGLSIQEISKLSGKKPNAIYVSIYRSLKNLKHILNNHD